jgi:hypothetical protein
LHHIHPPTPFPYLFLIPSDTQNPRPCPAGLFSPPVFWFCKRKKLTFLLV